jgi:hypothetical protein
MEFDPRRGGDHTEHDCICGEQEDPDVHDIHRLQQCV